jgi:hypothetical protein
MPGIKLTIPPNSPEFSSFFLLTLFIFLDPIERLFRTIKKRFPDLLENDTLYMHFIVFSLFFRDRLLESLFKSFKELPSHLYKSFFQASLKDMGSFLC